MSWTHCQMSMMFQASLGSDEAERGSGAEVTMDEADAIQHAALAEQDRGDERARRVEDSSLREDERMLVERAPELQVERERATGLAAVHGRMPGQLGAE